MKHKYTATFSNGHTVTRTTERSYAVAWMATWDGMGGAPRTGFSSDASKVSATSPTYSWRRPMSSNERAKAKREQAAYLLAVNYKVEIVPTNYVVKL
jgi:hypothetical protein